MNNEILAKARAAKSPEELLKLAQDNGMSEFTEESAKAYFEVMHKSGELADDELEQAAGGCKTGDGRRVVTRGMVCPEPSKLYGWQCKTCHKDRLICSCGRAELNETEKVFEITANFNKLGVCGSCDHCIYQGGKWFCNDARANSH